MHIYDIRGTLQIETYSKTARPKKVDWRSSSAHFLSPISVRGGGERGERVRNAANVLSPVPLSPLSLFFFSLDVLPISSPLNRIRH